MTRVRTWGPELAPEGARFRLWAPAQTGLSLVGANGPVTLRVTTDFDSPVGRFQQISTQVVNERTSITGQQ